jgi:DtxR family Mn-dependent transcriptional regulator
MEFVMAYHNLETSSESEQMYLITIARMIEDGCPEPIPLSEIAKQMSILPVSVNQMVRKLEGAGLLRYLPYKGVEFTPQGAEIASRTLRNRRLWEVFLVDHLKLSLEDADGMACTIEHITTDEIAMRLSDFLGEPTISPGGQPIPRLEADQAFPDWVPLIHLTFGTGGEIAHIDAQPAAYMYLNEQGLRRGAQLIIEAIGSQGSRLVELEGEFVELSENIAKAIWMERSKPNKSASKGNSR